MFVLLLMCGTRAVAADVVDDDAALPVLFSFVGPRAPAASFDS